MLTWAGMSALQAGQGAAHHRHAGLQAVQGPPVLEVEGRPENQQAEGSRGGCASHAQLHCTEGVLCLAGQGSHCSASEGVAWDGAAALQEQPATCSLVCLVSQGSPQGLPSPDAGCSHGGEPKYTAT